MKLKIVPGKNEPSLEQLYLLEKEYHDAKERFEAAKRVAIEIFPSGAIQGPYVWTSKQYERENFSYGKAKIALPCEVLEKLLPFVSISQVKTYIIDKVGEE